MRATLSILAHVYNSLTQPLGSLRFVGSLLQSKSLNIPDLYMCGDSTFPGIGIPGVAASGTIAANSFVGIREHNRELSRSRKANILQ